MLYLLEVGEIFLKAFVKLIRFFTCEHTGFETTSTLDRYKLSTSNIGIVTSLLGEEKEWIDIEFEGIFHPFHCLEVLVDMME